jgi:hypothetical protein
MDKDDILAEKQYFFGCNRVCEMLEELERLR